MLVFSTQLCELLPSNILSVSPPPPLPPSQRQSTEYTVQGVGGGVLSCFGDHILQEYNTLFLTSRKGGGLRQINTCRKAPFQVNFFR
jgi:hypothetical protein